MIGGGMLYIDDKARGVHEGYLVTPITKIELVFGLNAAGAIKAVLTGVIITIIGSLMAGVGTIFHLGTMLGLLMMIVLTSVAFNTMMFLLMVRVEDPLVPRAMFGVLNTLLFFPSGAIYPIQAFPKWLTGHRHSRSVYLCGAGVQGPAAEGNRVRSNRARYDLSLHLRGGDTGGGHAFVQAHVVIPLLLRSGTFRRAPESFMLR